MTLDLSGSSFDTVLGVYTGADVANLTKIDENDDENFPEGVLTSRLSLRVDNGVDYKIDDEVVSGARVLSEDTTVAASPRENYRFRDGSDESWDYEV